MPGTLRDSLQQRKAAVGHRAGWRQHRWNRGERLPAAYRGSAYYVDYRTYGYRAPPRGYRYVRVDNDVVLVAIATGLISSILLNQFE